MGLPSVCCVYVSLSLVNKEAALTYDRVGYSSVVNPNRYRGAKKMESGSRHVASEGEEFQNLMGKP